MFYPLFHLLMIMLAGNVEQYFFFFCTFHVTLFKPKYNLPPASVLLSPMCGCCVSQLSCTRAYISGTWNVTLVVSIFNMRYDARRFCLHPIPIPVAGCKSLQKFEVKKWHKWKWTLKIKFDRLLCLLCLTWFDWLTEIFEHIFAHKDCRFWPLLLTTKMQWVHWQWPVWAKGLITVSKNF